MLIAVNLSRCRPVLGCVMLHTALGFQACIVLNILLGHRKNLAANSKGPCILLPLGKDKDSTFVPLSSS